MDLKVHKTIPDIKWPHRIVDNFFSEEELSWVQSTFEKGYKNLQKDYPQYFKDGKLLPYGEIRKLYGTHKNDRGNQIIVNGFSAFIPFWDSGRLADVIDDVWKEGLDTYTFDKNQNIKRKDYFTFLELNIYPAGLTYSYHMDSAYKAFTGVAYIGETGTGTTLKSGNREVKLNWKHNRGLLFMNCDGERRIKKDVNDELSTWHKYKNDTDEVRYAVNFNMTHMKDIHMTLSHILYRDRHAFEYKKVQNISPRESVKFYPIQVALKPEIKK